MPSGVFSCHLGFQGAQNRARPSLPAYGLLAAAPVEAQVRPRGAGTGAPRAGLVTVGGGAVALVGRHAVATVAVVSWKQQQNLVRG